MSHISMSHTYITPMNQSHHTYQLVIAHIRTSRITRMLHTHTHTYAHTREHTHTHVYTHTHTHTHTHKHSYTHTSMRAI